MLQGNGVVEVKSASVSTETFGFVGAGTLLFD